MKNEEALALAHSIIEAAEKATQEPCTDGIPLAFALAPTLARSYVELCEEVEGQAAVIRKAVDHLNSPIVIGLSDLDDISPYFAQQIRERETQAVDIAAELNGDRDIRTSAPDTVASNDDCGDRAALRSRVEELEGALERLLSQTERVRAELSLYDLGDRTVTLRSLHEHLGAEIKKADIVPDSSETDND